MKKILSLSLALLLWAALPLQAWAEEAPASSPSPAPSFAPDTYIQESPAPETVAEHPLPDSSPLPSPSPVPAETVSQSGSTADESGNSSSIFDFLQGSSATMEVDMVAYYLSQMSAAAVSGDREAGLEAAENRNALIDQKGSGETKIAFDDLYLLSKLISAEAGSDWLSDEFRMCVGEVVLNRVASPEFPDTIYDVVYQKNQYSSVSSPSFAGLVPSQDCVDAALRLLQGERLMVPSVVFQSNYAQGEIFSIYEDHRLGNTYFCVSNNLELYP